MVDHAAGRKHSNNMFVFVFVDGDGMVRSVLGESNFVLGHQVRKSRLVVVWR
jgi:hypothetical protein